MVETPNETLDRQQWINNSRPLLQETEELLIKPSVETIFAPANSTATEPASYSVLKEPSDYGLHPNNIALVSSARSIVDRIQTY